MLMTNSPMFSHSQSANTLAFGRKLRTMNPATGTNEVVDCQQTIEKALNALDKKNFSIIMHGPSFPQTLKLDTSMGSPYTEGAKDFMRFLKHNGFNSVQLGPEGFLQPGDPSPYASRSFSSNILFIDLPDLASSKWSNLLNKNDIEKASHNNDNHDFLSVIHRKPYSINKVDYENVFKNQQIALKTAYENFKEQVKEGVPQALAIENKLNSFVERNRHWVERDAIYDTLLNEHANDPLVREKGNDFSNWDKDIDKNLYAYIDDKSSDKHESAIERRNELAKHEDVDFYKFCQFVANEQKLEMKNSAAEIGIRPLADREVAFSNADVWANQEAFLDGWKLGVPPDYFSKTGQAWNFPVINPEKLFVRDEDGKISLNKDGTPELGAAGKLIKDTFDKIFSENPGGVRIDHIIGLIDPWVYPEGGMPCDKEAGRLFTSPELPTLAKYAKVGLDDLNYGVSSDSDKRILPEALKKHPDLIEKYAEIIEQIIIPSAEEHNVPRENIICEDLGTVTTPVPFIMKKLDLSGIKVTEFVDPYDQDHGFRGDKVSPKDWITTGTHDNDTLVNYTNSLFNEGQIKPHAAMLADQLVPKDSENREVSLKAFEKNLSINPKAFIKAKVAELFASPSENVQIFFSDIFGMTDRYNLPGTPASQNWNVRVPNNYEDFYHKQLEKNNGINLPEVLKIALESRGEAFVKANKLDSVLDKLSEYASILKEKEPNTAVKSPHKRHNSINISKMFDA